MNTSLQATRRSVLTLLVGLGIGSDSYRRVLAAQAADAKAITAEMLEQAEWIADIELTEEERDATLRNLQRHLRQSRRLREVEVDYTVAPCVLFQPAPGTVQDQAVIRSQATLRETLKAQELERPESDEDLAFLPVTHLSQLIRHKKVTSQELTEIYLRRLETFDPILHCVVTLTKELAREQARRADEEINAGEYRGPLHGIPWGAKDLMAVPGYPTTWGATPYRDQAFDHTATIAQRLEDAGAVLVAKLSLGALAMGDRWMAKKTRNPWNPQQGSSGSSAGSASAATAGLVGFTIGTETLGSIVSPCRRCGATGLRPTFGRVSRYGLMPLAWTMDKAGPICRSVEDCALVFDAIHGTDGKDPSVVSQPFQWPFDLDVAGLRVGYVKSRKMPHPEQSALNHLREHGAQLVPVSLPNHFPVWEIASMLQVEAATMFDDLTRNHVTQDLNSWPDTFRAAQFVPAVEYLRASRVRSMLMQAMEQVMEQVDLYVGGRDLGITNLTGHPTVVLPKGFETRDDAELPQSITLTGRLYEDDKLLAVADVLQRANDFHLKKPPLQQWMENPPQEDDA